MALRTDKLSSPEKTRWTTLPSLAHPFRRQAARLSRPHVPILGEVDRRPRAPGFGCIVDAEPSPEAAVAGQALAPEITLQPGIIT